MLNEKVAIFIIQDAFIGTKKSPDSTDLNNKKNFIVFSTVLKNHKVVHLAGAADCELQSRAEEGCLAGGQWKE